MADVVKTILVDVEIDTKNLKAQSGEVDKAAQSLGNSLDKNISNGGKKASTAMASLKDNMGAVLIAAAGAAKAVDSLFNAMSSSITSANKLQAAMTGLDSIATAFGQSSEDATKAAQDLATDGLMTVTDAATGLKNLLASGFSLDQAIKLMNRFKDSAAFGRQASLGFGQAIASATEGIKNGNSILVDNAGVTKNLSMILTDAGYSQQDLMKATTDAGVRMAIFNGILKETEPMLGDAAKLSDSAAGKQAVFAAQTEILSQQIGLALQPALLSLLNAVTPIIVAIGEWTAENPKLASTIIIAATVALGLIAVVGALGIAIMGLKPIFAAFKAFSILTMTEVGVAFTSTQALLSSPIVLTVITAAAVAALIAVYNASRQALQAVDDLSVALGNKSQITSDLQAKYQSVKSSGASQEEVDKWYKLYQGSLSSDIELAQKASEINMFSGFQTGFNKIFGTSWGENNTGWATGGFTGRGSQDEVAGLVHRGEYVLPQNMVNQATGMPEVGSNIENHIGNITISSDVDGEKWLQRLTQNQEIISRGLVPTQRYA